MEVVASQRTVSTELYVPPSPLGTPVPGHGTADNAAQAASQFLQSSRPPPAPVILSPASQPHEVRVNAKRKASSSWCVTPTKSCDKREVEGTSSHGRSDRSARKSGKRRKGGGGQFAAADVGSAVGLTVTAAEAMVVSSFLEAETAARSISPSAILEAAIQLRRARKDCGLDDYHVGDNDVPMEEEDHDDSLDTVTDSEMLEALADVGFVDPASEAAGVCVAGSGELEGYGLNWGRLKIGNGYLHCDAPPNAPPCDDATPETVPHHNSSSGRHEDLVMEHVEAFKDGDPQGPATKTLEAASEIVKEGDARGASDLQGREQECTSSKQDKAMENVHEMSMTDGVGRNPDRSAREHASGTVLIEEVCPTVDPSSGFCETTTVNVNTLETNLDNVNCMGNGVGLESFKETDSPRRSVSPITNAVDNALDVESRKPEAPKVGASAVEHSGAGGTGIGCTATQLLVSRAGLLTDGSPCGGFIRSEKSPPRAGIAQTAHMNPIVLSDENVDGDEVAQVDFPPEPSPKNVEYRLVPSLMTHKSSANTALLVLEASSGGICRAVEKSRQVLAELNSNVVGEKWDPILCGANMNAVVETSAHVYTEGKGERTGRSSSSLNRELAKEDTSISSARNISLTVGAKTEELFVAKLELRTVALIIEEVKDGDPKAPLLEDGGACNKESLESELENGACQCVDASGQDESLHVNAPNTKDNANALMDPHSRDNPMYQSRWLGGWREGTPRKPAKNVACAELETSYISEPWDTGTEDAVPERAAALKRQKAMSRIYQKGTIFCRSLASAMEGTSGEPLGMRKDLVECMPQGSVSESSALPSLADPLCSFVPCSIPEVQNSELPLEVTVDGRVDPLNELKESRAKFRRVATDEDAETVDGLNKTGQSEGPLDSVQRTRVHSLRPYSTTAPSCSLQMLLHAVDVAGDGPQQGGGDAREGQCVSGNTVHKRRGAAREGVNELSNRPVHVDSSLQLLDDEETCEGFSLEALAGEAARATRTPDKGVKPMKKRMKTQIKQKQNQGSFVEDDGLKLDALLQRLDVAASTHEALGREALDGGGASPMRGAWTEEAQEDDETLHKWRTNPTKEIWAQSEGEEEDLPFNPKKRRNSDNQFCGCSSDDQSPPLLWPGGKMRRLRACRVIDTGSDDLPTEGQEAWRGPSFPVKEGCTKDGLVIVVGLVATEEVQQVRTNPAAAFKVFSFTQEENMLLAHDELQDGHVPAGINSVRTSGAKKITVKKTTDVVQASTVKKRLLSDEPVEAPSLATKKRKAAGGRRNIKLTRTKAPLFRGLQFLLTGCSHEEKEDLTKSIQEHGGVVLPNIPHPSPLQGRITRGQETAKKTLPIVLAHEQVRTSKYLYGCAVGAPTLKVTWLSDSAAAKKLLPFTDYEHKPRTAIKKLVVEAAKEAGKSGDEKHEGPLFHNFQFFFHGRPAHCTQLKTLVQHGGGKVVSNVKSMGPDKDDSGNWVGLVVAEDLSKVPHSLRHSATSLKLPLVAEAWVVESLLTGRRLPLPTTAANRQHHALKSQTPTGLALNLQESPLHKKKMNLHASIEGAEAESDKCALNLRSRSLHSQVPKPNELKKKGPFWEWLGMSSVKPPAAPQLAAGLTDQVLDAFVGQRRKRKCLFYSSVAVDGVQYSLGDIIEIQPLSEEETTPFIARLEGLWPEDVNKSRSNKSDSRKKMEMVVMRCRWFYRPFETGFHCTSSANDIYLSNHFDDGVHISRILKRVKVSMVVQGEATPCNNWAAAGDAASSSNSEQVPDYNCSYLYDHEKESLHLIQGDPS